MSTLHFVVVTGISVSTTCYDDPTKDRSGPALIKYLTDKSNEKYVSSND
jgi:molybdopterin biosynthesis enzyme MoaB